MVYLNGVRLTVNSDYTVDPVVQSVTLARPQPAGAMVAGRAGVSRLGALSEE